MRIIVERNEIRSPIRTAVVAAFLATSPLMPSIAQAQSTCGDQICERGFECNAYNMTSCPRPATPGAEVPECEATLAYDCVPAACSTDADCADDMVCHSSTVTECSGETGPQCDPAMGDCGIDEPATPVECNSQIRQVCTARYDLPCQTAADCGPGFTCEEQQSCWCSGSSGTAEAPPNPTRPVPPTDPGDAASSGGAVGTNSDDLAPFAPVPEPGGTTESSCGCAPSGFFACQLQTIACDADTDCPSGLTCQDNGAGACWVSSDGTSGCTTPDPAKQCQPRRFSLGSKDGGAVAGSNTGEVSPPTPPPTAAPPADGARNTSPKSKRRPLPFVSPRGCAVSARSGDSDSPLLSLLLGVGLAMRLRRRRS